MHPALKNETAMLQAIDHVQIAMPVGGEDVARSYYDKLLGLGEVPKPPKLAVRGGCWFESGSIRLHLGVEKDFRAAKKAHVAINVRGGQDLRRKLTTAGFMVKDDDEIDGVVRFFSEDPFGNKIEFIEI
ncbi:MAG: glyoxalase [Pseudomonadota bacterium]